MLYKDILSKSEQKWFFLTKYQFQLEIETKFGDLIEFFLLTSGEIRWNFLWKSR